MDRDIKETLMDEGSKVTVLDWWDVLGLESDMAVFEAKRLDIVDGDGVILSNRANRVLLRPSGTGRIKAESVASNNEPSWGPQELRHTFTDHTFAA
jgi:hypothetical protein